MVPSVLFCLMDTLYLLQEHKFVAMYNDYIKENKTRPAVYEMPIKDHARGPKGFFRALFSWSVGLFYGILIIILTIGLFNLN